MARYDTFWPDPTGWSLQKAIAWGLQWATPGAIDPIDNYYMATLGTDDLHFMRQHLYPLQHLAEARAWVRLRADGANGELPPASALLTLWQLVAAIDHLERMTEVAQLRINETGPIGQLRQDQRRVKRLQQLLAGYHDATPDVLRLQLYVPHVMQRTFYGTTTQQPATAGTAQLGY